MHREAGVALMAAGSCLCLVGIFPLRLKLWAVPLIGLLAAAGVAIGSGALLVQRHAGVGDWVLTLTAIAVLFPAHFRALLGRLGRPPSGQLLAREGFSAYKRRVPMSSQGFDAGFNTEPSPPPPSPGGETVRVAQTVEARRERGLRKAEPRYTRVVVKKVGPWSVLKFSLLFYLCVMLVILFALVILYSILGAIGALDSITRLTRDLGLADETFEIKGGWLFSRALMFGFAMVIVWSLINLLVAFLYNLISDVVGGIDVTLAERR